MLIQVFLLLLGLGLLTLGADRMVEGASALAKKHNISEMVIGLTIVSFGTSAPELVVNTFAAFQGHQDIVFGNIIGSNMFNLFAILGIAGLITPLAVRSGIVWKEIPLSLFGIIMLFVFANDFSGRHAPILTRIEGLVLLIMFLLFLFYMYRQLKTKPNATEIMYKTHSNLKLWAFIIFGLVGMVAGGKLVVMNGVLLELYLVAGGTAFLFIAMFTGYRKKLDRWEAGILLVSFIIYMVHLIEIVK